MLECADGGEAFIVAVIMHEGHARGLRGARDQEVDGRDTAMVSGDCEQQLQLASALPQGCGHRYGLEGVESPGYLLGPRLVWAQTDELEDHDVADEHVAGRDLSVEPARKLRKAPISRPGPYARVKQGGALETWRLGLSWWAQRTAPGGWPAPLGAYRRHRA